MAVWHQSNISFNYLEKLFFQMRSDRAKSKTQVFVTENCFTVFTPDLCFDNIDTSNACILLKVA